MNVNPNYPVPPMDPDSPGSPAMPTHPSDFPKGSNDTVPVPGPLPGGGPAPLQDDHFLSAGGIVGARDPYSKMGEPMDIVPQVPVEMEAVEAPEELSDAWITLKVKGALAVHREVSALSTEVVTDHGVVILAGSAVSQHERQVATSVAEGIKGVKRVDNRMQVYNERP